jgi:hypothetical protein
MRDQIHRLQQISALALRQHVGVAAEFVVADALKKMQLSNKLGEQLITSLFLQGVVNELPAHLPIPEIMADIKNRLSEQ